MARKPDNDGGTETRFQAELDGSGTEQGVARLIDAMLRERSPRTIHQGRIVFSGGRPRWEKAERVEGSVLEGLMAQGAPEGYRAHGTENARDLASFGYQFGVLTRDGIVLDTVSAAADRKASYFSDEALGKPVADVLRSLPVEREVPFYVTMNTREIPAIREALESFARTQNGVSPVLAFLPLLAGQQPIPEGREYDSLRALKTFLEEDVDFIRIHCPGGKNAGLEKELNRKLSRQHMLWLCVALYLAEFNNVEDVQTLIMGPLIGGLLGTGVAVGASSIHTPSSVTQGLLIGGLTTAADGADNFAGSIPEITSRKRNGENLSNLTGEYTANSVSAALAGMPFDVIGGEIFAHGGGVWHVAGAALISIMTSLGFAANAKSKQDGYTQAYRELLDNGRIPPSDAIIALQRQKRELEKCKEPESEKAEELTQITRRLNKETSDYAKALGMLETVAARTTTRANLAMLATPAYGLIPIEPLQLALLGGSENYNLTGLSAASKLMDVMGMGYEARLKQKLAKGEDVTIMDLPRSRGAIPAQRLSYALGYIGEAPDRALRQARKFTERVMKKDRDTEAAARER